MTHRLGDNWNRIIRNGYDELEEPNASIAPISGAQVIRSALRRRRRLWVGMAVAGFTVGAALPFALPKKISATTDLYLAQPTGTGTSQPTDDVSLLETRNVAQKALSALHLHQSSSTFLSTYSGAETSPSILTITAKASSAADAVAEADAVAKAFLSVRAQEVQAQVQLIVSGLRAQATSLRTSINQLTNAINQYSSAPAGSQSTAQLANLVNQRDAAAAEVAQLDSQIGQDLLNETLTVQGSRVLDPATDSTKSSKKTTVVDALAGLIAGLGLGMGIVIVGDVWSDRPRRRAEIATALAVPVEFSVGDFRRRRRQAPRRRAVMKRIQRPDRELQMLERHLRSRLDSAEHGALAVITVEADEEAVLAVGRLASTLASEGRRVTVIDVAEGRPFTRLFPSRDGEEGVTFAAINGQQIETASPHAGSLTRTIAGASQITWSDFIPSGAFLPGTGAALGMAAPIRDVGALIVVASVDPAVGAEHIAAWASNAVILTAAGRATTDRLKAVGVLLRHAGVATLTAIVTGADATDATVGLIDPQPSPEKQDVSRQELEFTQW